MRLAIVASHPIQYYAPIYRELARVMDLVVFYAHRATPNDQARTGFGVGFDWDSDLFSGYQYVFLRNFAATPGLARFSDCDTPEVARYLQMQKLDAVLVQGWHFKAYIQAIIAAKRLRLPLLMRGDSHLGTPRSVAKKAVKSLAYPALLRTFDAALYVGQRSREYWERYSYPRRRLFFSPHCVDDEWFRIRAMGDARQQVRSRWNISPDAKVALFAGKMIAFKRPLDLVGAAAHLKQKGFELTILIAGSGPLEHEVVATANRASVPLRALGFCNQTAMPGVYAAADVLVLPSDGRETWGMVANEALACGRPVVLSDAVGAAPDLAADGIAGRVYPVGDVAALAVILEALITRPPSEEMIAAKSRAYAVPAAISGIEAALVETLGHNRGSRIALGSKSTSLNRNAFLRSTVSSIHWTFARASN